MKSTLTFYIVRHGKTVFNTQGKAQGWSDSPLTEGGEQSIKHLALGLQDIHFDAVYSSDLGRAVQTVELILATNEQASLPTYQLPQLREACFGSYESGRNITMWMDVSHHLKYASHEVMHEDLLSKKITSRVVLASIKALDKLGTAEDFDEVQTRMLAGLQQIADAQSDKDATILLVSHGMSIRVMLAAFGGDKLLEGHLDNGSVCKLTYSDGVFTLHSMGDMSYLEKGKSIAIS